MLFLFSYSGKKNSQIFEKFDIKNIDVFFSTRHQPSVLICNNVVMSGQAPAVDFDTIVVRLADRFPQINFILTNSEVRRIAKNWRKPLRDKVY